METPKSQLNQFFLHNRMVAEKNAAAAAAAAAATNERDQLKLKMESSNNNNSTTNDDDGSEANYDEMMAAENKLTSLKERIELLKLKDPHEPSSDELMSTTKSKLIDFTDLRTLLNREVEEAKKEKEEKNKKTTAEAGELEDRIKTSACNNQNGVAEVDDDDDDDDIEVDSLSNSTTRSRNSSTNVDELETCCYHITATMEDNNGHIGGTESATDVVTKSLDQLPSLSPSSSSVVVVKESSAESAGTTDNEERNTTREVSPFSVDSSSGSSSDTRQQLKAAESHEAGVVEPGGADQDAANNKLFLTEIINRDDCLSLTAEEKQNGSTELTEDEEQDKFDESAVAETRLLGQQSSTVMKRTHLRNLIYEMYELEEESSAAGETAADEAPADQVLIEGYMDKLPPGKTLKNSILLAWKRRYIRLNTMGNLFVFDIDNKTQRPKSYPEEVYNIMGGRVEYEQERVISIDDCRGNVLVIRVSPSPSSSSSPSTSASSSTIMTPVSAANRSSSSPTATATASQQDDQAQFLKWRNAFDSQIIDRSETLWVQPGRSLKAANTSGQQSSSPSFKNKKVVIIDIGTSSIRAGLFSKEPHLPKIFIPTVCSRDPSQNGKLRVGFDAFDSILASSATSTIDLRKSLSSWSLFSQNGNGYASQLIFPLRGKNAVDKSNVDMECMEAVVEHVVDTLNISSRDHHVVIVTPQKMNDKVNVQFLNLLLSAESKFQFESVTLINQSLLALYAYNSAAGVVANLGEKIDIVPWSNGITFQSGVSNLAYGGTVMSEYLNSYITRGHINYIHDMEQYLVRYIKEKSCYVASNYKDELAKYPNDSAKYAIELVGQPNEFKRIEIPESARFRTPEGLFDPEIWGIDGVGIHKLIFKAIQSTSMDLRREMARNIYLCGGMSRLPGLRERLELELKKLLPPTLTVKVNCSEHSYHCAFLGAYRFVQQPEYEKLLISRSEWSSENVNCLRKWRMM